MPVDRDWRWIAWLILGIGGLIAAAGVALGAANLRHVLYGERADGIVTEIVRDGDMYAPVVRFRLPQGEAVEVRDLASGAPDFAVGDAVAVLYLPETPANFRLATFDRLWLVPLLLAGFGFIIVGFGMTLVFALRAWG